MNTDDNVLYQIIEREHRVISKTSVFKSIKWLLSIIFLKIWVSFAGNIGWTKEMRKCRYKQILALDNYGKQQQ